jgi:uncharacterized membrane-anchored protein
MSMSSKRFAMVALMVAAAQTAILGYMIESRASVLRYGHEVLLKTAPIDPRDLLRGDYVVLTYDISRIESSLTSGEWPASNPLPPLAVRLKADSDGYWNVVEASFGSLSKTDDTVIMVASVDSPIQWQSLPSDLRVSYGIERFYVPEGEGKPIEDGRNQGRVSVAVRVSDAGEAQIRALMLDGEPLYEEPLY